MGARLVRRFTRLDLDPSSWRAFSSHGDGKAIERKSTIPNITMAVTVNVTRVLATLSLLFCLAWSVTFPFAVFPPDMFLVPGEPAISRPGLECVFLTFVASMYAALSLGVAYALYIDAVEATNKASSQALIFYHCGSIYSFYRNKENSFVSVIMLIYSVLCLPVIAWCSFAAIKQFVVSREKRLKVALRHQ